MIECYLMAFNEEETIHFSIRHYQQFCQRVTILNNYSTDRTVEIAYSMGCRVKNFGTPGILSDRDYIEIKNNCWKKEGIDKRDFVIVCDCDEILQPPTPANGATIFKTQGFNIFSHGMPKNDWLEITTGIPDENYSKTVIFDPKAITDINFHIGSHMSRPKGKIIWSDEPLTLFHYRNVGGPQRLVDRHKIYRARMSKENIERKFGIHYLYTDEKRIKEWESKYAKSNPFSLVGC